MTHSRRRWFRFSLRTLFVVVTVLGCWLGHEVNVVRHRNTSRREIERAGGYLAHAHGLGLGLYNVHDAFTLRKLDPSTPVRNISWLRQCMDDRAISYVEFNRSLTESDRQALLAFPEATVYFRQRPGFNIKAARHAAEDSAAAQASQPD